MLVLLLAVGPLKAHAVFACEMMDVAVHDTCCCDEHENVAQIGSDNVSYGASMAVEHVPCCERSAALGIDEKARQNLPTVKPPELQFDTDPPDPLLAASDMHVAAVAFASRTATRLPVRIRQTSGSDTWLITRRLRI